jgi:hypothetical protein
MPTMRAIRDGTGSDSTVLTTEVSKYDYDYEYIT